MNTEKPDAVAGHPWQPFPNHKTDHQKMSDLTTNHGGIVITYDEHRNKWLFTLRDRDRSVDTLTQARDIIDKPLPKEKAKPFEKIAAWFIDHGDDPARAIVTGTAEKDYAGRASVWINKDGQRSKEAIEGKVYPSNPANDELVSGITAKRAQIKQLENECRSLRHKLQPLVIAPEPTQP
jgi:hypothetical protein